MILQGWIFQCLGKEGANCDYSTTRSSSKFFRVGYEGCVTIAVRSSAAPYFVTSAALFFGHLPPHFFDHLPPVHLPPPFFIFLFYIGKDQKKVGGDHGRGGGRQGGGGGQQGCGGGQQGVGHGCGSGGGG